VPEIAKVRLSNPDTIDRFIEQRLAPAMRDRDLGNDQECTRPSDQRIDEARARASIVRNNR
jgi:hypothetical protein